MTPNIGQGANTAIEDAAVLASLIHRLVKVDDIPSISKTHIDSMLQEYQSLRYERAKTTYQRSKFGARFHTRDDWAKAFAGRYIFPFIGGIVERGTAKVLANGEMVDYLPFPERSGPSWVQKSSRGTKMQLPWRLLLILPITICWAFLWIRPFQA